MADLDGMPIVGGPVAPSAGGAFLLNGAGRAHKSLDVGDGWVVETRPNSRYVLARGGTAGTYDDALRDSFDAAQRGLDLLCIKGVADHNTVDADGEHIAWWTEDGGLVLRTVMHNVLCATVSSATVIITDKDGNPVPQLLPPPTPWDASFRYYRLSQLTDDLTDAYRNLWLAFESLLDEIEPFRKGQEREGQWLERALARADSLVGLTKFVSPGPTGDTVKAAYDIFYLGTRNFIFHAKRSQSSLLPHGSEARGTLAATYRHLLRLYLALVEATMGTSRPSSGIYFPTFLRRIESMGADLVIHATDDDTPFDPDQAAISPGCGHVARLATGHAPELAQARMREFLGRAPASALGSLSQLSKVVTTIGGDVTTVDAIKGRLTLGGVAFLEAQVGIRLGNANQPKDTFFT